MPLNTKYHIKTIYNLWHDLYMAFFSSNIFFISNLYSLLIVMPFNHATYFIVII